MPINAQCRIVSSELTPNSEDIETILPPAPAAVENVHERYSYWRFRVLYAMIFGYAAFYLVRLNFSMAIPAMEANLGYSKTQLGAVISVWSIVYGVGKFMNGYFSDRSNARYFMSIGLMGAALTSLIMGWSTSLWAFTLIWAFNAWFQSMGWPPISRLLTHWFSPTQLGTKWGLTNMSHQIGGAIIVVMGGYLIEWYSWEAAFLIPGAFVALMALVLFNRLRDTPESLGLPPMEVYENLATHDEVDQARAQFDKPLDVLKSIFSNKLLWYVCLGNMFLYIVRMGVINWAPTFLKEFKGEMLSTSGWQLAAFEIAGMLGGISAGWISDRLFKGRRGPVSCFYMLGVTLCLCYFWWVPPGMGMTNTLIMFAVGFLVYGPQVLVGVAAADFASKQAVGMAVGLTGTFAYIGGAISGVGVGWIADHYGWNGGFCCFLTAAFLGMFFFALTWRSRAQTLNDQKDTGVRK